MKKKTKISLISIVVLLFISFGFLGYANMYENTYGHITVLIMNILDGLGTILIMNVLVFALCVFTVEN